MTWWTRSRGGCRNARTGCGTRVFEAPSKVRAMQDQDVIREFLVESYENLSRLDQEVVELEKHPKDAALLASIFRTIHTIKGTCGFLAFSILESITHQAESLLS